MEKEKDRTKSGLQDYMTYEEFEDETIYDEIPDNMKSFWRMMSESSFESLNYDVTANDKPDWLDIEKFKRGQKFAQDNYCSLSYTVIHALLMLFTDHLGRRTFIFAKSFIPSAKAHKQILTISTAVKSWITNDIWDDNNSAARARMRRANKMHEHYYREIFSSSMEKIAERTALKDINAFDLNLHRFVNEDFKNCFPTSRLYSKYKLRNTNVTVSQGAASFTLFGLAGLVITYPKYYGFHNATEEDLEAYAHMWKALGYLLGVRDEYNFMNGELDEIRNRTKSIIDTWMRPAFRELNENWEYLARSFIDGSLSLVPNSFCTFEAIILDLVNFLGVDFRLTKKSLSYGDYVRFLLIRFSFLLFLLPGVRTLANTAVNHFLIKSEEKLKVSKSNRNLITKSSNGL